MGIVLVKAVVENFDDVKAAEAGRMLVVRPKERKLIGNPDHGGEFMIDMYCETRPVDARMVLAAKESSLVRSTISGGGAPSMLSGRLWRSSRRSGVTPGTDVSWTFRRVRAS